MNVRPRDIVVLTCPALAAVLFVSFFFVDFVRWLTRRRGHDLLSQIVALRPGFPNQWRNVLLDLILPVLLAGFGLYLRSGDRERT
jgi:hypothetical protein